MNKKKLGPPQIHNSQLNASDGCGIVVPLNIVNPKPSIKLVNTPRGIPNGVSRHSSLASCAMLMLDINHVINTNARERLSSLNREL